VKVATLGVAAVLAIGGVATAVRLGDRRTPPPAHHGENVGPYTHWLYVADSSYGHEKVLAVDTEAGTGVAQTFPAGAYPLMTSSPDGSRLYVMSDVEPAGVDSFGSVIDTWDARTGKRLTRTALPELDGTFKYRTGYKLPPFSSDFVASLDGSRIYLGERTLRRGSTRALPLIGTFDTSDNSLLANSVEIPDCWTHVLVPGTTADELTVVCSTTSAHATVPATNFVYFLRISDDGSAISSRRVDLPSTEEGREELAWAAGSPDNETIYAVTVNGRVFTIDVAGQRLESQVDLDLWPNDTVQLGKVVLSPDAETLYLGTASAGGPSIVDANRIRAFATDGWSQLREAELDWYWSLALGPDGTDLYAPTFGRSGRTTDAYLQVYDAATLERKASLTGIGISPNLVEVPRLGR
jgi:DNA-binding beta-propeller fold protein YncE